VGYVKPYLFMFDW